MKTTTIAEINELENGFPVLHFKGNIKSAFPPKQGKTEYGEWKVQSATIEDETGEISVSFMDSRKLDEDGNPIGDFSFPDLRNYAGSEIKADCSKSDKHGFVGVVTNDYTNKKTGVTTRQLKITDNAQVYYDEATSTSSEAKEPTTTTPAKTVDYNQQARNTKESYEKQAALKAAVDFVAFIATPNTQPTEVVEAAKLFYGFFTTD